MRKVIFTTFILTLLVCGARAQARDWLRLESDSKDFSLAIPRDYQMLADENGYDSVRYNRLSPRDYTVVKLRKIRYITAFQDGASFLVESYQTNNLSDALETFMLRGSMNDKTSELVFNEFKGKMLERENGNFYSIEIIAGSKDRIYRIVAAARDGSNETLRYFLASLNMNAQKYFSFKTPLDEQIKETPAPISGLKETTIVVENDEKTDGEADKNKSTETKTAEDKKLVIVFQNYAKYTDEARKAGVIGRIKLLVTFSENGYVSKIVVKKGLPNGLIESAIKAARMIRFLPSEKDNKPLTTTKTIEYSFSIY
jgi:TonB family protein